MPPRFDAMDYHRSSCLADVNRENLRLDVLRLTGCRSCRSLWIRDCLLFRNGGRGKTKRGMRTALTFNPHVEISVACVDMQRNHNNTYLASLAQPQNDLNSAEKRGQHMLWNDAAISGTPDTAPQQNNE